MCMWFGWPKQDSVDPGWTLDFWLSSSLCLHYLELILLVVDLLRSVRGRTVTWDAYTCCQNGSTVTSTHIPPTKANCCQWHGNIFPTIVETLQISMSMAWYIILMHGRNKGECGNSFYKPRIYSKAHILMAWLYLSKRWLTAFISWRSSEDKMR